MRVLSGYDGQKVLVVESGDLGLPHAALRSALQDAADEAAHNLSTLVVAFDTSMWLYQCGAGRSLTRQMEELVQYLQLSCSGLLADSVVLLVCERANTPLKDVARYYMTGARPVTVQLLATQLQRVAAFDRDWRLRFTKRVKADAPDLQKALPAGVRLQVLCCSWQEADLAFLFSAAAAVAACVVPFHEFLGVSVAQDKDWAAAMERTAQGLLLLRSAGPPPPPPPPEGPAAAAAAVPAADQQQPQPQQPQQPLETEWHGQVTPGSSRFDSAKVLDAVDFTAEAVWLAALPGAAGETFVEKPSRVKLFAMALAVAFSQTDFCPRGCYADTQVIIGNHGAELLSVAEAVVVRGESLPATILGMKLMRDAHTAASSAADKFLVQYGPLASILQAVTPVMLVETQDAMLQLWTVSLDGWAWQPAGTDIDALSAVHSVLGNMAWFNRVHLPHLMEADPGLAWKLHRLEAGVDLAASREIYLTGAGGASSSLDINNSLVTNAIANSPYVSLPGQLAGASPADVAARALLSCCKAGPQALTSALTKIGLASGNLSHWLPTGYLHDKLLAIVAAARQLPGEPCQHLGLGSAILNTGAGRLKRLTYLAAGDSKQQACNDATAAAAAAAVPQFTNSATTEQQSAEAAEKAVAWLVARSSSGAPSSSSSGAGLDLLPPGSAPSSSGGAGGLLCGAIGVNQFFISAPDVIQQTHRKDQPLRQFLTALGQHSVLFMAPHPVGANPLHMPLGPHFAISAECAARFYSRRIGEYLEALQPNISILQLGDAVLDYLQLQAQAAGGLGAAWVPDIMAAPAVWPLWVAARDSEALDSCRLGSQRTTTAFVSAEWHAATIIRRLLSENKRRASCDVLRDSSWCAVGTLYSGSSSSGIHSAAAAAGALQAAADEAAAGVTALVATPSSGRVNPVRQYSDGRKLSCAIWAVNSTAFDAFFQLHCPAPHPETVQRRAAATAAAEAAAAAAATQGRPKRGAAPQPGHWAVGSSSAQARKPPQPAATAPEEEAVAQEQEPAAKKPRRGAASKVEPARAPAEEEEAQQP